MSRCKITELLQDIWSWLVSTTHLPPCHLSHFQKKKEKEILINQIVCAYSANDHDPSACKYFIAVKWRSFFWLSSLCLGDLKLEILNKFLIWSYLKIWRYIKISQKNWGQTDYCQSFTGKICLKINMIQTRPNRIKLKPLTKI